MQEQALADLENVWEEIYPEYPMQFDYVELHVQESLLH